MMYKDWIKSNGNSSIFLTWLNHRVQHSCTFNTVVPLMTFCQMFGRRRSPSARPSLLIFRTDSPKARISSCPVLYRVLRSGSFTLAMNYHGFGWVWWMFQNLPLPAVQEVQTAAAVWLLALSWRMMGFCTIKCRSFFSPWIMWLRSLRQSEKTTVRDPVQHMRWTYLCYRAVNKEHQQRWKRWWCKGATIWKVRKYCTPVNKAMSEISNYWHYLSSNPCIDLWLSSD